MSELQRLCYFSRCAGPTDVEALVAKAAATNSAADITGLLFANDEFFLQVLEGARGRLSPLFLRIASDARHTDVTVVEAAPIAQRSYPNWGMARFNMAPKSAGLWPGQGETQFDPTAMSAQAIKDFLRLATFELMSHGAPPLAR